MIKKDKQTELKVFGNMFPKTFCVTGSDKTDNTVQVKELCCDWNLH